MCVFNLFILRPENTILMTTQKTFDISDSEAHNNESKMTQTHSHEKNPTQMMHANKWPDGDYGRVLNVMAESRMR